MRIQKPDGYLSIPEGDKEKGVLVLHPWWGLNETIKDVCNRLSEAGYLAFAPDLYHGKIADTIADAEKLVNELDEEQARSDIVQAVNFLIQKTATKGSGLAVIAFSMGVYFGLELSNNDPDHIQAVVTFYGTRVGDYNNSIASYLCHFAEIDEFEDDEYIDQMETDIRNAGRPVEIYRYPGTGHWFFEENCVDAYKQDAARLAWERTLGFLRKSFED